MFHLIWFCILIVLVLFGVFFYKMLKKTITKLNNSRIGHFLQKNVLMNPHNSGFFFKFVFVAIGHPVVVNICLYITLYIKAKISIISGGYYQGGTKIHPSDFVLYLLCVLLFYAGWLVMLTGVFKIIKPKLNIRKFLNEKLDGALTLSFLGCVNFLVWFLLSVSDVESNAFGFIFGAPMLLLMLLLICISLGMFLSNLISVLKGKYNYDYDDKPSINLSSTKF